MLNRSAARLLAAFVFAATAGGIAAAASAEPRGKIVS
jgi:hypothetical protein